MQLELIKLAIAGLAVLGCIGLLFGIGLALAARKFAVHQDPRIEKVRENLAGAN
jgi:electron transport complex protein RnfB